jgi:hypothetical protein
MIVIEIGQDAENASGNFRNSKEKSRVFQTKARIECSPTDGQTQYVMKDILGTIIPNNRINHILELVCQKEGGQIKARGDVGIAPTFGTRRGECRRVTAKGSLHGGIQKGTAIGPPQVGTNEAAQGVDSQMSGQDETIGFVEQNVMSVLYYCISYIYVSYVCVFEKEW